MALTRKMLKAMSIEDDVADQIIEAHAESVDALKKQRDQAVEAAGEADELKKQLEEAKAKADGDWQAKYEQEHEAFEAYKAEEGAKATKAAKAAAYKELLVGAGVDPRRVDAIIRVTDLEKVELGEDGKLSEADELEEAAKKEWADFVVTKGEHGEEPPTPPASTGGQKDLADMTTEEYMAYKEQQRSARG